MNIILDTNIYLQDPLIKSTRFELLLDYLKKTSSRLILPQIVIEELEERFHERLIGCLRAYKNAQENLQRCLVEGKLYAELDLDIDEETDKYLEYFLQKLGIDKQSIVSYRNDYLNQIVSRAIKRLKPFSDRGEEFRDAILWFTVLDVARNTSAETLAFISNDTRAFGKQEELYDELGKEIELTGVRLKYYNSIKSFMESHASKVDFITTAWLHNTINFVSFDEKIQEKLSDRLSEPDRYSLRRDKWEGLQFTGYIERCTEIDSNNLANYYVYEKADSTLFVEATYYVEYEIEFTREERERIDRWLGPSSVHDYVYGSNTNEKLTGEKRVYQYREAEIIFGITIADEKVTEIELISLYI